MEVEWEGGNAVAAALPVLVEGMKFGAGNSSVPLLVLTGSLLAVALVLAFLVFVFCIRSLIPKGPVRNHYILPKSVCTSHEGGCSVQHRAVVVDRNMYVPTSGSLEEIQMTFGGF